MRGRRAPGQGGVTRSLKLRAGQPTALRRSQRLAPPPTSWHPAQRLVGAGGLMVAAQAAQMIASAGDTVEFVLGEVMSVVELMEVERAAEVRPHRRPTAPPPR